MERFLQLSYYERRKIHIGLREQKSIRTIAKNIERSVLTISREVKRNSDSYGYLYPEEAHQGDLRNALSLATITSLLKQ